MNDISRAESYGYSPILSRQRRLEPSALKTSNQVILPYVIPAKAGIHRFHPLPVVPAKAGTQF